MAYKFPDRFNPEKATSYLDYKKYFSVDGLWKKVAKVAKKAGLKAIYAVLLLYYTSVDRGTPWKAKAVIYGALGYFILPLDFIPDAVPFVGYGDDMAALTAALKAVWEHITPAVHEKAFARLHTWFPEVKREDVGNVLDISEPGGEK